MTEFEWINWIKRFKMNKIEESEWIPIKYEWISWINWIEIDYSNKKSLNKSK